MNSVELFIANTFYLHEAAFLADNSARELGNLYSMKKKTSYQTAATLCPPSNGINVRREIKIQWVKRFHLHVCIPHGAPLFLFRQKTLTITMMMTCPYRRIGIGCYFLYHQTTSWILALGQRQKEVNGNACRCRDTFAFAHLCEAENRKENSEANAPKKKKKNMHLKSLYCYPGGERAKMQLAAHPRDRRTCSQNHWNTEPLWRQRSKLNVIRKCNKFSQSQTKTGRTQLSASRLENALYQWKKIKSLEKWLDLICNSGVSSEIVLHFSVKVNLMFKFIDY